MLDGFNHTVTNDKNRGLKSFEFHPFVYSDDFNLILDDNTPYYWTQLMFDESLRRAKFKVNFENLGLISDEDFNVFVDPRYGAFFANTDKKTIEEVIEEAADIEAKLIHHGIPGYHSILNFMDQGYEFQLGPVVKVYEYLYPEEMRGIYCTNYNQIIKKLEL